MKGLFLFEWLPREERKEGEAVGVWEAPTKTQGWDRCFRLNKC